MTVRQYQHQAHVLAEPELCWSYVQGKISSLVSRATSSGRRWHVRSSQNKNICVTGCLVLGEVFLKKLCKATVTFRVFHSSTLQHKKRSDVGIIVMRWRLGRAEVRQDISNRYCDRHLTTSQTELTVRKNMLLSSK